MPQIRAEASAAIGASAAVVYDIISDYHEGHPSILPPRWFTGLEVEEGGRGAGTIIRFGMKAYGSVRETRAAVDEPEPGRWLTETTLDPRHILTTFLVDSLNDRISRVTISSTWSAGGPVGWVEAMLAPRMLRRVFEAELSLLDEVARARQARSGGPAG